MFGNNRLSNEYRVLLTVAFWIFIWTFAPYIALPLFIIVVFKQFRDARRQRKLHEAQVAANDRWMRMEGLYEQQKTDPADWWK